MPRGNNVLAVYQRLSQHLSIRPNTNISDHDLALRLGVRYVSIRGGYRWTKAGNTTLKGPIFGLALTY